MDHESPPATGPEIEFANIGTSHDGHRDLSGVSFTAPAGSITAVMGNPGGGKSLLMRHLLDEDRPDEGRVLVDGQSLWEQPPDVRRRFHDRVGVLRGGNSIQESELDDSATVRDNLASRLAESDRTLNRGAARTVEDCLAEFDLTESAESRPADLDGAAARRLAVAVALLADPSVVVLDDPGRAVDVHHLRSMTNAITGWQQRTGATVILTVHSIELARETADHLVVLHDGRVVESGAPGELLADVKDSAEFEQRFNTRLSFREADPENLRRRYYKSRPFQLVLVALVIIIGVALVIFLLNSNMSRIGPQHEGMGPVHSQVEVYR